MEKILMNTENSQMNELQKFFACRRLRKLKLTFCSSKRVYLLHAENIRQRYNLKN